MYLETGSTGSRLDADGRSRKRPERRVTDGYRPEIDVAYTTFIEKMDSLREVKDDKVLDGYVILLNRSYNALKDPWRQPSDITFRNLTIEQKYQLQKLMIDLFTKSVTTNPRQVMKGDVLSATGIQMIEQIVQIYGLDGTQRTDPQTVAKDTRRNSSIVYHNLSKFRARFKHEYDNQVSPLREYIERLATPQPT